ncbi:hypothetical protein D3C81_1749130 [compost metagenome]
MLPATLKLSTLTFCRSIGVPQTSRPAACASGLCLKKSSRSPCRAAGRRVLSLFQ